MFLVRWYKAYKRWRYERWARAFALRNGLPFEGIMNLGGYRVGHKVKDGE